jgi:Fe-S-cluster-containing dehydrogenase component
MPPMKRTTQDNASGARHWRSLAELEGCGEREPESSGPGSLDRREFLKLMAASLALAGASGCAPARPEEKIVPYVRSPEEVIPGRPLYFATAMPLGGAGLLVESHMGRPTKVEGNPDHPASLGATDAIAQASILTLYDPDRSQTITHLGDIQPWGAFLTALRGALDRERGRKGEGLRILTETVTSPTLADQLESLLADFPRARWHQYEPVNRDMAYEGARLVFGEPLHCYYRFDRADIVVALDADPLGCRPGTVRYARDVAARRRVWEGAKPNRLYAVESTPTLTGAKADHRLPLRAREVEAFAVALAARIGVLAPGPLDIPEPWQRWIEALATDLERHPGASLVVPGEEQTPRVHALAHAINHRFGAAGRAVVYTAPIEARPVNQTESLRELVRDMEGDAVDLLVILGGNPAYNAPADLEFARRLEKVRLSVHLSLYADETSYLCHWHIPEAHFLEAWSDTRAFDGTAAIVQPLVAPLYGGKSAHELLAAFTDRPERSGYDIVRDYWRKRMRGEFETAWRRALHDGVVAGSAFAEKTPRPRPPSVWLKKGGEADSPSAGLELVFRPDPTLYDGRFANNGWLQELPKPLTKLTWDNAALMSPATARRLGVTTSVGWQGGPHGQVLTDLVDLALGDRTVRAPVWILPGHPDDSVTVHLGYGRVRAGRVGSRTGFNAYALRTSERPWFQSGLEVRKAGATYQLASTQAHHSMEGRDHVRAATLEEFRRKPDFAKRAGRLPSLYPEYPYTGHRWGMAIDLSACIGCNACVVACQAENNIPVVGKREVLRGHEMHWLRIDRYYAGPAESPETRFQPVPCMHCEKAPCEVVCPVTATAHSADGLNDMVYNRCVGTRYCSNNCPYKVRRFNFLQYSDWNSPLLKMLRNPDVTVRSRGVMEKCTYCVQRIRQQTIQAEREGRRVRDGEVLTACQQACPTQAIVFGDINDGASRVRRMKESPLDYGVLAELNTQPRTTYLAEVRNPNPELQEG